MNSEKFDDNIPTLTQIIQAGDQTMANHFDASYFDSESELTKNDNDWLHADDKEELDFTEENKITTENEDHLSDINEIQQVEVAEDLQADIIDEHQLKPEVEQDHPSASKQEPFIGQGIEKDELFEETDSLIESAAIHTPTLHNLNEEQLKTTIDSIINDTVQEMIPEIEQKLTQRLSQQIQQKLFNQNNDH